VIHKFTIQKFKWQLTLPAVICLVYLTGRPTAPSLANPPHIPTTPCTVVTGGNELLGGLDIYMSKDAVRVQLQSGKTYLVARAPDWRVVLFNPSNNHGMSMPLQKWLDHTPQYVFFPVPDSHDRWMQSSPSEVEMLGRRCTKLIMNKTTGGAKPGYKSKDNEYILLDIPTASPAACHIVQNFLGVPPCKGIPLSFRCSIRVRSIRHSKAFEDHVFLKSTKIDDSLKPKDFFSYPTGFKNVNRETDVITDNSKKQQYENILGPLTAP
jgi:hypothetical protein